MSQRFQYRLQVLLDQKVERMQECERALADRRAEFRAAQQELDRLLQQQSTVEQQKTRAREAMYEGECDGDQLQRLALDVKIFHRRLQDAKDAVLTQRIDLEEKQEAVQQAAAAVADATRDVEVLRKHREKSERRFLAELERKETNEQDEIASAMYETRRRQL